MHILILSKRNAQAQTGLLKAAEALAGSFGLDPALVDGLKVTTKDKDVRAMQEREAVAALLEELAYQTGALERPAQEASPQGESVTVVTEPTGEPESAEDSVPGAEPIGDDLPPPTLDDEQLSSSAPEANALPEEELTLAPARSAGVEEEPEEKPKKKTKSSRKK